MAAAGRVAALAVALLAAAGGGGGGCRRQNPAYSGADGGNSGAGGGTIGDSADGQGGGGGNGGGGGMAGGGAGGGGGSAGSGGTGGAGGKDAPDAPPADKPPEVMKDAPAGGEGGLVRCGNGMVESGEACDDGNGLPGDGCTPDCRAEGCADGTREGFLDTKAFPNVAACGPGLHAGKVAAEGPSLCEPGWMLCSPAKIKILSAPKPTFSTSGPGCAWLVYEPAGCEDAIAYPGAGCTGAAGLGGVTAMATGSTGACGACPSGGYAPVSGPGFWGASLALPSLPVVCYAHVGIACGRDGGTSCLVACCR